MIPNIHSLKKILAEALMLSSPERMLYLNRNCGHDGPLHDEIERLLSAQKKAGRFLETPLISVEPELSPDVPGTLIGPYLLLKQIGEGGFGRVFLARKNKPIVQHVALKIIKAGVDTREAVARFQNEHELLALMDHPHIARVLDGVDARRPAVFRDGTGSGAPDYGIL